MRRFVAPLLCLFLLPQDGVGESLKILTFNVRGVPVLSSRRTERIKKIAARIKKERYDIVALQEIWQGEDVETLKEKAGLDHSVYYGTGVTGSGLMLLSRWPIRASSFQPFGVKPSIFNFFWEGEALTSKGILRARVALPEGELDVYNLHVVSEYRGAPYVPIRLAQLYEAVVSIEKHSPEHPLILLGDFNMVATSIEHRSLGEMTGLQDSCVKDGKETCEKTSFDGRIDGIWVSTSTLKELDGPRITMKSDRRLSDHLGVEARIERRALFFRPVVDPLSRTEAFKRVRRSVKSLRGKIRFRIALRWLIPVYNLIHFSWYRHQLKAIDLLLAGLDEKIHQSAGGRHGKKRPVRAR